MFQRKGPTAPACSSRGEIGEILRELNLNWVVLHAVFLRLRVVFTLQLATCNPQKVVLAAFCGYGLSTP
jgi:hypothetical protein